MEEKKDPRPDGRPLAICINDCEIDYGQKGPELARVCFRLGCAFAEMRWGSGEADPRAGMRFLPVLPSKILTEKWQN